MTWACVLGCAGMTGLASVLVAAEITPADANPYSVISDRNVFHLNPPPPPPPAPDPKPVDLPKVMLTGFVGKGSSMKVLLAIPPKDAKETIYYTSLVPGQKDHDVELVKIHLEKEEVDIINSGTAQTLSVKSNSYMATASAPAPSKGGGAPGMPPGIGLRHQQPGFPPQQGALPQPSPAAAITPSGGGGGGSAIVAGGGGNSSYGGYNSSSGGAIVSGGSSAYAQTGSAVPANNVGNQIANTLFNPATGHYQMPTPNAAPLPPQAQHAAMLINQAAGGPPAPPAAQAELEAAEGGPPPPLPP